MIDMTQSEFTSNPANAIKDMLKTNELLHILMKDGSSAVVMSEIDYHFFHEAMKMCISHIEELSDMFKERSYAMGDSKSTKSNVSENSTILNLDDHRHNNR